MNHNIPLKIFQTWKTKVYDQLPCLYKKSVHSWKQFNPNCIHQIYDDADCENLVRDFYPQYFNIYQKLELIRKVDMFRYLVIHKFGGAYADMDTECIKSIEPLIQSHQNSKRKLIVGLEMENGLMGTKQYLQWFFISEPGNPFFIDLVDEICKRKILLDNPLGVINVALKVKNFPTVGLFVKDYVTYWLTGPYIFSEFVEKYKKKGKVSVYSKCSFGYYSNKKSCLEKGYVNHHFGGSWKTIKIKTI